MFRINFLKDCRVCFIFDMKVLDVNCDNCWNGIVIRNFSFGDCIDECIRLVIFIYLVMFFDIEVNRIFKFFKMFGIFWIFSLWKVILYFMDWVLNFDIFCLFIVLIV